MIDSMVQFTFMLGAFIELAGMIGGLFALAALFWFLGTKQGRSALDWFGDRFL